MNYEIRARSFGEILDGAFQLFRNHVAEFLGIAAIVGIPMDIVSGILARILVGPVDQLTSEPKLWFYRPGFAIYLLLVMATVTIGTTIQMGALVCAIADAYLGRPVTIERAFQRLRLILGNLLGAGMLTGIAISFGFLMCLIPGMLLGVMWLFVIQAVVIEGRTPVDAMKRSADLMTNRWAQVSLLAFAIGAINWIIAAGMAMLIPSALASIPVLGHVLQRLPSVLIAPLYPAVLTLAYFDVRVTKEAFDLEMLAEAIDAPGRAGPSP